MFWKSKLNFNFFPTELYHRHLIIETLVEWNFYVFVMYFGVFTLAGQTNIDYMVVWIEG